MNIAFSALVILFLALPGICFLLAYRAERGRPVGSGSLTDEVPVGIIVSVAFHTLGLIVTWIVGRLFIGVVPDLKAALIVAVAPAARQGGLASGVAEPLLTGWYPFYILAYFTVVCGCSAFLGRWLKTKVREWGLDRRYPALRWNDWFYLLRGESPEQTSAAEEYDSIAISAVVEGTLYRGFLYDFFVNKSGELDTIVLVLAERRKLGEGEESEGRDVKHQPYYPILADYLVLKYSTIANLAVTMASLGDPSEVEEEESPPRREEFLD
ncbi:MAG: hypothetical protein SFU86_01105 [Pirellulaceae bacterium]|nr:hypothetical protein [Pirellulaceae bacterium]